MINRWTGRTRRKLFISTGSTLKTQIYTCTVTNSCQVVRKVLDGILTSRFEWHRKYFVWWCLYNWFSEQLEGLNNWEKIKGGKKIVHLHKLGTFSGAIWKRTQHVSVLTPHRPQNHKRKDEEDSWTSVGAGHFACSPFWTFSDFSGFVVNFSAYVK